MDFKKMKYLKSYETYTNMNYPDLYDEPVPDYVDNDYYRFQVDDKESEPPNKTGRDDREVRTKKEPIIKINVD